MTAQPALYPTRPHPPLGPIRSRRRSPKAYDLDWSVGSRPAAPPTGATGRVSVVIPAYKAEKTIRRAVDSVLAQRDICEVIVVVDGLLDATADLIGAHPDPRVRLVVQPQNLGAQATRNHGLRLARGAYVLFVDSDDFVEGALVEGLLDRLMQGEADVTFGPMQIELAATGERRPGFVPDFTGPKDLFTRWLAHRRFVAPCSVLWRTAFLHAVGGWDETVEKNQDGELVLRAALLGARIAVSQAGCGVYVQHAGTSISRAAHNLHSLLPVSEKMLRLPSAVVDQATRRKACGLHNYLIASDCFRAGREDLGIAALRRARELGMRGHRGPVIHRLLGTVLGLRRKDRLVRSAKRNVAELRALLMPMRRSAA